MTDARPGHFPQAHRDRREAMLADLLASMRRHHAWRRRRRRAAAAACLPLLAAAVWLIAAWPTRETPETMTAAAGSAPPAADPVATHRHVATGVRIVRTGDLPLASFRVERAGTITVIDDDQLLRSLVAARRPAGLIEIDGRMRLSADVIDDRRADAPPGEAG